MTRGRYDHGRSHRRRPIHGSCLMLVIALVLALALPASARIGLDGALHPQGLWCFPLVSDAGSFLYLPSRARLAEDESGEPAFSLLRYVEKAETTGGVDSVALADGGAVLHFLVSYDTPDEQVKNAETAMRRLPGLTEAQLAGPVVFEGARYSVVSSTLRSGRSADEWQWLASGAAPVLEGGRIALSFDLDPTRSRLLLESLRQPTSDVSVVFDLTFRALSPAFDADLVIDWTQVRRQQDFQAGASYAFVGAEIELLFDKLVRDGAIRLESRGSDATMEALLGRVYAQLLELMFEPAEPESMDAAERGGLLEAMEALTDPKAVAGNRKLLGYGANIGYRLKQLSSEGRTVLSFRHRASIERHHLLTVNLGDLYARFGDDDAHFRVVNLEDPAFRQREVHVAVDGSLLPEFDDLLNHVSVTLRKRHAGASETLRELVLRRGEVEAAGDARLAYGWDHDSDLDEWLRYDYRVRWSFRGGRGYETPWRTQSSPVIGLDTPYERRPVLLVADGARLTAAGVRAVSLEIETPFFGENRTQRKLFRIAGAGGVDTGIDDEIEVILPRGEPGYRYRVRWIFEDGHERTRAGIDHRGVLFLDEFTDPSSDQLPEDES